MYLCIFFLHWNYSCWINMFKFINDRSLNNSHWSDDTVVINFIPFFRAMNLLFVNQDNFFTHVLTRFSPSRLP